MSTLPLRPPLYRKAMLAVICLALAAGGLRAYAQRKRPHRLRAIALVELWGPAAKPTGGRVLPVAIKVDDKYYDAATYDATPRPVALDPGTVYEAVNNGEPVGFFTIGVARQEKGEWSGLGQWKSRAEVERAEKAAAAERRDRTRTLEDEGPPKLHKPGTKKPAPAAQPGTTSKPAPAPKPASEDRPQTASNRPEAAPAPESDPDRPTLRRGGGPQVSATLDLPPPAAAPKPGSTVKPGGPSQVYLAVSDPDGTGPTRSYAFPWKPAEERELKAKTIALAEAELEKYRAAHSAAPPRSAPRAGRKPTATAPPKLEDAMVVGYDLNLDNNVELVVTGRSGKMFVTLIARTNLEFVPQKLYAVVTDAEHLSAVPRMELVGTVDAEGKGKGDLVFRVFSDSGWRYAIFRTHRDEAWSVWQSGLYER